MINTVRLKLVVFTTVNLYNSIFEKRPIRFDTYVIYVYILYAISFILFFINFDIGY